MTALFPALPAARRPGRYAVALVCLGNICRSPMAHVVLEARLAEAGLAERVQVSSSGTGDWHVGRPMDPRAAATLTAAGLDPTRHRARTYDVDEAAEQLDLVLVMDAQNRADVAERSPTLDGEGRLILLRDLDPDQPGGDVPDPYYGGDEGFEEVLAMVERSVAVLVGRLAALLAEDAR